MINLQKFFSKGTNNTVLLTNSSGFSYRGPWKKLHEDTVVERWHSGDFCAAEITIVIDFATDNKEIIKALICNSINNASITVYGRNNFGNDIAALDVQVNQSYVDLVISPIDNGYAGAKFIYSVNFYENLNTLTQ
jgi:hypothetical protein